jgi:TATA-box binding protein (TBP) (component of TFIID and TFIIIB)
MNALNFTPLRISTLVTTGHLGTNINLTTLFEHMQGILIPMGYLGEGFLKMEHEKKVIGHSARDMLTKRRVSDKTFFNQSTIVIRKKRVDTDELKEVNIKLFANGGFQMTGVTSEEFSRNVLVYMLDTVANLPSPISERPLTIHKFAIQLLNSDYKVSALIKRAELHQILCRDYRLSSTLETTIYQGVNTKYYYNEGYHEKRGICTCPRFCNGQGDGSAIGQCKKITIAAFQTGSIIITGARNRSQLDEAYGFMNTILETHKGAVTKAPALAPDVNA